MVIRARLRRRIGTRLGCGLGAAFSLLSLGGCSADKVFDAMNPVTWYHDVTGSSKKDAAASGANAANLEAGSDQPYPNLSSVPNEPTRGLTEAERQQLAQGLVADSEHAHYTDETIRAGDAGTPAPPEASAADEELPYVRSGGAPAATADAAAAAPEPAGSSRLEVGGALGSPEAAPPPRAPAGAARDESRAMPVPPAPVGATRESSLATPAPRAVPQPETPRAPPLPARLKPLPPPGPEAPVPGAPAPHAPVPGAATAAAEVPPPPQLAAMPAPAPAAIAKRTRSDQVAELGFAAGSSALPADARSELAKVPSLHRQFGGIIRIVGYAAATSGGADPSGQELAAFHAALERANAVKQVLVADGVSAAQILTEASPVRGTGNAPDRADVYVEY